MRYPISIDACKREVSDRLPTARRNAKFDGGNFIHRRAESVRAAMLIAFTWLVAGARRTAPTPSRFLAHDDSLATFLFGVAPVSVVVFGWRLGPVTNGLKSISPELLRSSNCTTCMIYVCYFRSFGVVTSSVGGDGAEQNRVLADLGQPLPRALAADNGTNRTRDTSPVMLHADHNHPNAAGSGMRAEAVIAFVRRKGWLGKRAESL